MSLISDPDYVIHNLRLNYLRHVDDPYGPRIISISQKHCANPLVVATGLDDPDLWPELRVPSSPKLAAVDASLANGSLSTTPPVSSGMGDGPNFGATGLRHSETIYGSSRNGAAGMRVSGRFTSNTPRNRGLGLEAAELSTSVGSQVARLRSDSAPTPSASTTVTSNPIPTVSTSPGGTERFPQTTPRRRGSAGTALTRFNNDSGRLPPSTPLAGCPVVPASNGITAAVVNLPVTQPTPSAALPSSFHAPIFARAAEMEARRRERMRQRLPLSRPLIPTALNHSLASSHTPSALVSNKPSADEIETPKSALTVDSPAMSDEEVDAEDEDEEDEDEEEFRVASTDAVERAEIGAGQHEDEFDPPDLLRADSSDHPMPTSVPSDELSLPSQPSMQSMLSTSQSSAFAGGSSHLQVAGQLVNRSRLSPVTESRFDEQRAARIAEPEDPILGKMGSPPEESFFDSGQPSSPQETVPSVMVSSASEKSVPSGQVLSPVPRPFMAGTGQGNIMIRSLTNDAHEPPELHRHSSKSSPTTQLTFAKRTIPPLAMKSALTAQLASQFMPSDNPFTDLYAAVSGRAEPSAVALALYFPHSRQNRDRPIQVTVRKDASVEEIIGFGLWTYWDKGLDPRLDEGLLPEGKSATGDKEREIHLSTVGWCLRMVEEDGEPDEDFPALDRSRPISKFAFDAYAICEATEDQVKQNEVDNAAIVRRPSRLTATRRQNTVGGLGIPESKPGTSVVTSSGITALANTAGLSGLVGPPVFLRVRMAAPDAPHFSTTIHTTSDTYIADVLDAVCRKRRLPNPKEWGLMTSDMTIAIPLDRTVASLEGKFNLVLVARVYLQENGFLAQRWKTTDPNASIYHKMADTADVKGSVETGYRKFNVYRKMPVLGRHERTLAIDGHYIHIFPSSNMRAFASSSKTSSHHITAVVSCKQSRKVPQTVKLVVMKDGVEKRYELEAENVKEAAEIVSSIKGLQKSYQLERNGTYARGTRARRSRVGV